MRQRRHLPSCVSGRPQIAHAPTVGSRSIPVNASALFKSEPRMRSMPFSITPVPFECWPEGASTRALSLRAGGIAAARRLDFNLLLKIRFALPRSCESRDSRPAILDSTLIWSESGRDNEALDRHRPDHKLCSPLPSLALRGNADANAKARYAALLRGLQVSPPLLLDLAASVRCRQRTALAPQAIPLSLPPQMHFPNLARRVSRYSTPMPDRKRANR